MKKRKKRAAPIDHGAVEVASAPVETPLRRAPCVKVGDIVTRVAITLAGDREIGRTYTGEVVYIHPQGRFHTVAFRFGNGAEVRESFLGVER